MNLIVKLSGGSWDDADKDVLYRGVFTPGLFLVGSTVVLEQPNGPSIQYRVTMTTTRIGLSETTVVVYVIRATPLPEPLNG